MDSTLTPSHPNVIIQRSLLPHVDVGSTHALTEAFTYMFWDIQSKLIETRTIRLIILYPPNIYISSIRGAVLKVKSRLTLEKV